MAKKKAEKAKAKKEPKKKSDPPQDSGGEQLDLIDVHPANAKEILRAARAYKKAQKERIAALEVEATEKQNVLDLVKKANLQPSADGSIKFTLDGVKISITPRDELVKVKFKDEGEESEAA